MSATKRGATGHQHVGEHELNAFVDGELDPDRTAAVEAAIDLCAQCRDAHGAISDVADRVRSLELEPVPPGLFPALPAQEPVPLRVGLGPWLRSLGRGRQLRLAAGMAVFAVGASLAASRISTPQAPSRSVANISAGLGSGFSANGSGTVVLNAQPSEVAGVIAQRSGSSPVAHGPNLPASATGPAAATGADTARIARTGVVHLEVTRDRFDRTVEAVQAAEASLSGYTAESQVSEGETRSAQVMVRVPTERFQEAMTRLRSIASVVSYSTSAADVTKQYVDSQARLGALKAQVTAMTRLLDRANSVSDVLAVQQQLGQLQTQVDQAQGDINLLNQTTALASITVTVTQQSPAATSPNRLGDAVHHAGDAFINTLQAVIVGAGTVAPLLLLAGGAVLIVVATRRRRPVAV